jgi:hypothetical protein
MADIAHFNPHSSHREDPNFLAVVAMSGIALLLAFAAALLIVWLAGRHLVPAGPKYQPAVYLTVPAQPPVAGPATVAEG